MCLWLTGCATTQPEFDWASRVGVYTYDQAVIDLGPPDKMATLSDDSVVAEWMTRRGRYYGSSFAYGYYGYPYGPYGYYPGYAAGPYTMSKSPDTYLRLVFGPDKLLRSWADFRK